MSFVLDASIALSWALNEEPSAASEQAELAVATAPALVPPLWLLEVGNVLAVKERQGRLREGSARLLLGRLLALDIEVATSLTDRRFATDSLSVALEHQLSTYDANYLLLARIRRVPLATNDRALASAAEECGVELLGSQVAGAT